MEWIALVWAIPALLVVWFCINKAMKPYRPRKPYSGYLQAPPAFWMAPEEVKWACCNGTGPDGVWGWFVPETIFGVRITEAANIHDWMYVWATCPADKDRADVTFLINLIKIINEETTSIPGLRCFLVHIRHRRAITFYDAVCAAGGRAYSNAPKARPVGWRNPDFPITETIAGLPIQESPPEAKP